MTLTPTNKPSLITLCKAVTCSSIHIKYPDFLNSFKCTTAPIDDSFLVDEDLNTMSLSVSEKSLAEDREN